MRLAQIVEIGKETRDVPLCVVEYGKEPLLRMIAMHSSRVEVGTMALVHGQNALQFVLKSLVVHRLVDDMYWKARPDIRRRHGRWWEKKSELKP